MHTVVPLQRATQTQMGLQAVVTRERRFPARTTLVDRARSEKLHLLVSGLAGRCHLLNDGRRQITVEGRYARQFAHGVMIGLCSRDRNGECVAISTFIEAIGDDVAYACLPNKQGRSVHPSCDFAPAEADFKTLHSRDLTGWLWTGLIERISLDQRSWE